MAYTVVNAVTFVVGILFLLKGYDLARSGREDIVLFLMSGVIGVGLLVVAVFPNVFDLLAALLGLELKARAILVVSNLTLFVVIAYLFSRIGKLYDNVSRLNEELSLLRTAVEEPRDDE